MVIRSGERGAYAPPANVLDVIEAYRSRGLTTPFTAEVLTRAGVPESVAPRTLNSLEVLGLVDQGGQPSEQLEALRLAPQGDFTARLREFVEGTYAEILQFADLAKDDADKVLDAFRGVKPQGQMRRMVTMFLGLCDAAGMIPDGSPAKPGVKPVRAAGTPRRSTTKKSAPKSAERPAGAKSRARSAHDDMIPVPIAGILSKLPAEGTTWTKAKRESFLKIFTSVLDFCFPIGDDVADKVE